MRAPANWWPFTHMVRATEPTGHEWTSMHLTLDDALDTASATATRGVFATVSDLRSGERLAAVDGAAQ